MATKLYFLSPQWPFIDAPLSRIVRRGESWLGKEERAADGEVPPARLVLYFFLVVGSGKSGFYTMSCHIVKGITDFAYSGTEASKSNNYNYSVFKLAFLALNGL
jgi:hypothetical protein